MTALPLPEPFANGVAAVPVLRDVIRATGDDAEAFLQGQLSQDIAPLAPGTSAWSLLLQPQGKVDAWLRVTRIDARTFLIDLEEGHGEAAMARLERFKLRTACQLDLSSWNTVALRGAGAATMEVPGGSGAEVVVHAEWPGIEGVDALGPDVVPPPDVPMADIGALDELRILCGVPAMGAELTDATIPAEAGIVERSVSFTKGCYTGQELVARIDSRGGNVPRRLCGVVAESEDLRSGDDLVIDGATVGTVTSVAGAVGLAYVRRAVESLPAAASTAGGTAVEVRSLPMVGADG